MINRIISVELLLKVVQMSYKDLEYDEITKKKVFGQTV